MINPPSAVLASLNARLVAPLGGRLNLHWLVEHRGERKVLRRWAPQPEGSNEYEQTLLQNLAEIGWPVAVHEEPIMHEGNPWSLSQFLPGEPKREDGPEDLRARGRLLAEFHAATSQFPSLDQRPCWLRRDQVLGDPNLDRRLSAHETRWPEEVRILRWHLDRARTRVEGLPTQSWPSLPIHGDFTWWNLRFTHEKLTGIIDFELARQDHRVADFALSWRGKYDDVIHGYHEISLLTPEEQTAITPYWWAELIEGACRNMDAGIGDDEWTIPKLLLRSPIMGPDAEAKP